MSLDHTSQPVVVLLMVLRGGRVSTVIFLVLAPIVAVLIGVSLYQVDLIADLESRLCYNQKSFAEEWTHHMLRMEKLESDLRRCQETISQLSEVTCECWRRLAVEKMIRARAELLEVCDLRINPDCSEFIVADKPKRDC